ncbi:MAG: hypothetical protein JWN44_1888 [Myxococcales bacterium]|nr:hypothetical protein [Myxococcales bacterium]
MCTLLVALWPLAARAGVEPELAVASGRAFVVRGADRLEVAAQLAFDHRANATAAGVPRSQPIRWKADGTAAMTTPDGALDLVLRLERTDVGTVSIVVDGSWRRPTWVHLAAIDLTLPADAVTLIGRDLVPLAAPAMAVLERFDPKWLSVRRAAGGYGLLVDDGIDAVVVRAGGGHVNVRVELESTEARPFVHDANCRDQWRAPNAHVQVPARLRTVDERVHARIQLVPEAAPVVVKAKFPDGRRAAVVITDHADQSTARTLAALAHGRSDQASLSGGLLGHHVTITKSLFAHGTDRPQLEDPIVVKLADELHAAGSEIVPHSATPKRDERPVTMAALDTFARWQARTWIDHQPETNCEAFGDQGFRSTGRFAIADLLAAHGYEYVWAEVDLEPGPLNLLRADHLAQRAPTLWPIGRLDAGGPAGLWMFRSQWAFLAATSFYGMYGTPALDRLERERGIHIAHTYLETYHPSRTRFGLKNLVVPVDPHNHAGGSGAVMLAPGFERLLASLEARQERGSMWIPTLAALGDRLRAMNEVKLTVAADHRILAQTATAIPGATFVVARPDAPVRVNGELPKGLRSDHGETTFWADLPVGDSVITVE